MTHATPTSAGAVPTADRRASMRVLAAIAVTMTLWASAFVVTRALGSTFSPGALALGRLLVAALALTALVAVHALRGRRPTFPRGRALALVIGYGAAWFGAYTVVFNAAEQHLDAGTTALLVNISPMFVAVGAGFLLKEGFPPRLLAGLVVAFAGVAGIAVSTTTGRYDIAGVVFAVVAAVLYAGGVIVQKLALRSVDVIVATWLGAGVGAIVCLPFAGDLAAQATRADAAALLGVAYLGVFPTAIAFTTWAYALARSSAGTLAASSYVVPAITVLLSWVFLAEVPTPLALMGGALCLTGVAVTRSHARRARR